ncbi:MAG: hypothetical protein AB8C84_09110 [Oligoflexales bacterium]
MKLSVFLPCFMTVIISSSGMSQSSKAITRQKVFGNEKTSIDFEEVDISGQRRAPIGSLIRQKAADIEHDFVRLRMRWHPEMIQSAKSLEYAPKN